MEEKKKAKRKVKKKRSTPSPGRSTYNANGTKKDKEITRTIQGL